MFDTKLGDITTDGTSFILIINNNILERNDILPNKEIKKVWRVAFGHGDYVKRVKISKSMTKFVFQVAPKEDLFVSNKIWMYNYKDGTCVQLFYPREDPWVYLRCSQILFTCSCDDTEFMAFRNSTYSPSMFYFLPFNTSTTVFTDQLISTQIPRSSSICRCYCWDVSSLSDGVFRLLILEYSNIHLLVLDITKDERVWNHQSTIRYSFPINHYYFTPSTNGKKFLFISEWKDKSVCELDLGSNITSLNEYKRYHSKGLMHNELDFIVDPLTGFIVVLESRGNGDEKEDEGEDDTCVFVYHPTTNACLFSKRAPDVRGAWFTFEFDIAIKIGDHIEIQNFDPQGSSRARGCIAAVVKHALLCFHTPPISKWLSWFVHTALKHKRWERFVNQHY